VVTKSQVVQIRQVRYGLGRMNSLVSFDLTFLFFFLGVVASWIKSDLEVPESASKFLSVFLLLSLGLKGGHEVAIATDLSEFYLVSIIGLASCVLIPYYMFPLLKGRLGAPNAAALAACYGSVSAVTLIAAQEFLKLRGIEFSGYMVALMALMEIPAILIALCFFRRACRVSNSNTKAPSILAAKSVVLLVGGFLIGLAMNDTSWEGIAPVVQGNFKGVLAFFLLDLGLSAQKQLREAWKFKGMALLTACLLPLINGTAVLMVAHWANVSQGDQIILAVLAGSASYIAAPAAIRSSIPTANPSLFVALPLAMTFPMNVLIGIPIYHWLSSFLIQQ
jgi:uncharacterized protein